MFTIGSHVRYFQYKLGNYDKQPCDQSVEQRILQGIDNIPVEKDKTNAFLIDVDVVRGSVFAKTKPRQGWSQAVFWGFLHAAFAPFYWNYWRRHTSRRLAAYIVFHFLLQFVQAVCFLLIDPEKTRASQDDVVVPCLLAICLGILHAHITAPHGELDESHGLSTPSTGDVGSPPSSNPRYKERNKLLDQRTSSSLTEHDRLIQRHSSVTYRPQVDEQTGIRERLNGDTKAGSYPDSGTLAGPTTGAINSNRKGIDFTRPVLTVMRTNSPSDNDGPQKELQQCVPTDSPEFAPASSSGEADEDEWVDEERAEPVACSLKAAHTRPPNRQRAPADWSDVSGLTEEDEAEEEEWSLVKCSREQRPRPKHTNNESLVPGRSALFPECGQFPLPRRSRHYSASAKLGTLQSAGHEADSEESDQGTIFLHNSDRFLDQCLKRRQTVEQHSSAAPKAGTKGTESLLKGSSNSSHSSTSKPEIINVNTAIKQDPQMPLQTNASSSPRPSESVTADADVNLSLSNVPRHSATVGAVDTDVNVPPKNHCPSFHRRMRSWSISLPVDGFSSSLLMSSPSLPPLSCSVLYPTTDAQLAISQNYNVTGEQTFFSPAKEQLLSVDGVNRCSCGFYSAQSRRFSDTVSTCMLRLPSQLQYSRWLHSSFATSSSETPSSDLSQKAKVSQRNVRYLELGSVHGIGAHLRGDAKCMINADHFGSGSCSSSNSKPGADKPEFVLPPVDDLHSELDGVKKLNLKNSASPHQLRLLPAPVDNSGMGAIDKCLSRIGNVQEREEDTVTTHSRQRAKFLRLFLHRASVYHNQRAAYYDPSMNLSSGGRSQRLHSHFAKLTDSSGLCASSVPLIFPWMDHHTNTATDSAGRAAAAAGYNNAVTEHCSRFDVSPTAHQSHVKGDMDGTGISSSLHNRRSSGSLLLSHGVTTIPRTQKSYWSATKKSGTFLSVARGQTASETEYDRINSDVGSDVASSSGPDEISPPTTHYPEKIEEWEPEQKHSSETQTRVLNGIEQRKAHRNKRRCHHLPDAFNRVHRERNSVSPESKSSCSSGAANESRTKQQQQQQRRTEKDQRVKRLRPSQLQPDVSLSNAEENPSSVFPKRSNETCSESVPTQHCPHIPQSFVSVDPTETNPLLKKYTFKPQVSASLSQQCIHLPSAFVDTVRCHIWEGEKLSKLNLTMLDIGWNVIRAVERQCLSSGYIVLACLAVFLLPMFSAAFHSNFISYLTPNASLFEPPAISHLPSGVHSYGSLISSTKQTEEPATSTMDNIVSSSLVGHLFSESIFGVYIRMIFGLRTKVFDFLITPVYWLMSPLGLYSTDNAVKPHRLVYVLTGRWIIDWFSAPDLQGRLVILLGIILRFNVYAVIFFLLCIAERTFQQRVLYAKYFFSLTSSRRARKYHVPQFRLNKLGHIKCWLTLRSYLRKRGPQRSVENIIAAAFYIVFVFGLALCSQLLSKKNESVFCQLVNWDILGLTVGITIFLHRFILLGTKITKKYRNSSVLITEQINLYLSMEKKPHKKDELMYTYQVLRLAENLLKEVDGPFRVCGWTVNPLMYNVFKLVLLSCFSALLSESLGFKLKLYKLKLNAANW
ncbi:unnamed protein product [Calicophoron daubneyi]|uniref:PHTF1/2 N-terminal domain-containing protein n=1 Tax=Calicophoron daubneyi TaxID=300641 RepID=A0AAV2T0Q2_CALDB